ncbi:helix-turn-helix domain-containing GNAT family N-acetyltransferase [Prauserella flavalba]|uniref:helix-turn-helix domain-containing GNAT family N-acetyltransferase n=1 Tax=Prauserella flavalba TaxID=1477506 RepID=UPI0036ED7DFF
MTITAPVPRLLADQEAGTYADWFSCLADPTRVRLLHAVATTPGGSTVGALTGRLGISQSTCSHHVRKLADLGFVRLHKEGTATRVVVNEACCTGLPHAADVVMGTVTAPPCCPADPPADVRVRSLEPGDWADVRRIYGEGIATGVATFETNVPCRASLDARWLPGHRWVAELDGRIAGWAALSPVSARDCYTGVAESSVYVGAGQRGRGVGKALLRQQVIEADNAGLWTLQASILADNRTGIGLHHSAGYRTVGIRERIAKVGDTWHDTVLLERRAGAVARCEDCA